MADDYCDEPTQDVITLYRIYGDAGNGRWLAYIGISSRWQLRMLQHEAGNPHYVGF